MSISIAVCELEAERASCRSLKMDIKKILLDDITGFEDHVEYDDIVELEKAHELFPDWGAFMKRNRISEETDAIYLDKIKKEEDLAILTPAAKKVSTGWVSVTDLDDEMTGLAITRSKEENRLTGWDLLSFDEMNAACSSCPLSWDKGRGCIGAFGPDNSALPEVAEKRNCPVVASIPESCKIRKVYTPDDASKMLGEIEILEKALPEEGKIYVRRYTGALERLKAVAEVSIKEGCCFYFF